MPAHELDYRPEVDGLRAVAVLAVVAFHAFPTYFPGGFVGVDVFFVISGFLISTIIFKQLRRSTFTIADFYRRRVRRIFPALATVLAACLLFGWYALLPDEFELLGKHTLAAALFVSNFVSWQEVGYFDKAAALKPLLHLWSLGIEEQFYLLWPLALMLLWKRKRGIGFTIATLTLASFALNIVLLHTKPTGNYYFPLSRFWELGLGCLLAWFKERSRDGAAQSVHDSSGGTPLPMPGSLFASLLPVVGVGLIGAAVFALDIHTPFPGWAALLPTAGSLCVLAAPGNTWFQRYVMGNPAMVFVGLISYPLYLWHWPLLSFATIMESETPTNTVRAIAVLLGFVLAWLTYRGIELPIRKRRRPRVALRLVGVLATLGIAGLAIFLAAGVNRRFDTDVRAIRQGPRVDSRCVAGFPGAANGLVNYCKATGPSPPAVIFMGDSRSQAIYDGMVAAVGRDYPFMLLGRGGCPPLLHAHIDADAKEESCNDTWDHLVSYVAATKPKVAVLVGGGSRYFVEAAARAGTAPDPDSAARAFKGELRDLIVALQKTSQVVYVREIPGYGSAPACFLRRIKLPGSGCVPEMERSGVEKSMAAYNRTLDELAAELPGLRLVDSIPVLCGPQLCSQRLANGEIIYSDELHLSPAGARRFVEQSGLSNLLVTQLQSP